MLDNFSSNFDNPLLQEISICWRERIINLIPVFQSQLSYLDYWRLRIGR